MIHKYFYYIYDVIKCHQVLYQCVIQEVQVGYMVWSDHWWYVYYWNGDNFYKKEAALHFALLVENFQIWS